MKDTRRFADYIITRAEVDACKARHMAQDYEDVSYFIATATDEQWFEQVFIEKAEAAEDQEVLEAYAQWTSAEHDIMRMVG